MYIAFARRRHPWAPGWLRKVKEFVLMIEMRDARKSPARGGALVVVPAT
jgi:hypothetical protein